MRVDFYQLSRDPAEAVVPEIAARSLAQDARVLVVAEDPALRERISAALWAHRPDSFLAHGAAGGAHDARQPILLADAVVPANDARFVVLADGMWRESEAERAFLLFGAAELDAARQTWRMLGTREGVERRFWKQDGGKWREGP